MAKTREMGNPFCMPKEKKNPNEDLTGMFSGTKKLEPADRDWSTDAMSPCMVSVKVKKTVPFDIEIELTANDIFNWLNDCQDSNTLRNLGNTALGFAAALEKNDDNE